ncbi:hypothetical protein KY314_02070 [Candidatus Woesearchaeota archaeon]|nr:hypothetical protein [Candidatus Woesearchaeota archaeon]
MENKILLFCVLMILGAVSVCADAYESNYTTMPAYTSSESAYLQISSMRYEPYPVNPGEYVKLWIKAENLGTGHTTDATFRLVPKFPFSLDSEEDAVQRLGQIGYGKIKGDNVVVLEYKLKVDKDAIEGENEIEMKYNVDNSNSWMSKLFTIDIADAQTDFDLVIQEVEDSTVAIAIANTGKNIAYSVIVKMPEQENFETIGTSGQMVGNLENGDYSMVSFEINEKRKAATDKTLQIQIDYTDMIGERRSVIKKVVFESDSSSAAVFPGDTELTQEEREAMREEMMAKGRGFRPQMMQQENEIYQEWWFWAIILGVVFVGWKGFNLIKGRKRKK